MKLTYFACDAETLSDKTVFLTYLLIQKTI